jgi:hypothetical protein
VRSSSRAGDEWEAVAIRGDCIHRASGRPTQVPVRRPNGSISAWNGNPVLTQAFTQTSVAGASFTGLAINQTDTRLFAANDAGAGYLIKVNGAEGAEPSQPKSVEELALERIPVQFLRREEIAFRYDFLEAARARTSRELLICQPSRKNASLISFSPLETVCSAALPADGRASARPMRSTRWLTDRAPGATIPA